MAVRPSLVLYSRSLLAQAVASLLRRERCPVGLRLEVVSIDLDRAGERDRLPGLRPQAIVVNTADLESIVLCICRAYPGARVLCLNPASETVEVLSRRERASASLGDLMAALKGRERR